MLREGIAKFALGVSLLVTCASTCATVIFSVNSTLDEVDKDVTDGLCLTASGTCTLRAALMQANHIGLPVTVNLPSGVYAITIPRTDDWYPSESRGGFTVTGTADVTIQGAGTQPTVVDGNRLDTVFFMSPSLENAGTGGSLGIHNVTIRGGEGLFSSTNILFHLAGALYNSGGNVSLTDCVVQDNVGSTSALELHGSTTITRTSISSNQGGGILDSGYPVTIVDSTIERNFDGPGLSNGFGIAYSDSGDNLALIMGSTIAGNLGGGLSLDHANVVVINSTIANNSTHTSGGGIFSADSTGTHAVNIYNTTIADNDADTGVGGGIFVESGSFNIYNTLIAGNTNSAITPDDCSGSIFSHANNLFGTTQNCVITKVNASQYGLLNSPDLLGSLADNGGPTKTIALLDGSNAIDGGPSAGCFDINSQIISEDQRGFPRPLGARCDIGAFESGDAIFRSGFE